MSFRSLRSSSTRCATPASCISSLRPSIPGSRSAKSPTASSKPADRPCSFPTCKVSEFSGADQPVRHAAAGWRWLSDAPSLDDAGGPHPRLLDFNPPPGSRAGKTTRRAHLAPLANAIPKIVRDGSVHEVVVEQPDLDKLTGSHHVAAGCRTVHHAAARHYKRSENERINVGMYRMQSTTRRRPVCIGNGISTAGRTRERGDR